jgi:flagellar protein FlaG
MDIGSVRPALTGITTPVPRAPAQSVQAVQTDLPARSAVTETGKSDNSNVGTSTSDDSTISHQRHMKKARDDERTLDDRVEMDSQTNTLIFQKVDVQSGDVVRQVPEESALRMHAMIVAWEGSASKGRTAVYDQSV